MKERRAFKRIKKSYHIEYGPLNAVVQPSALKPGTLIDLSAGGILFSCTDAFPLGTHLVVHIQVSGWRLGSDGIEKSGNADDELTLKTIAEVVRITTQAGDETPHVAARFLGRILPEKDQGGSNHV